MFPRCKNCNKNVIKSRGRNLPHCSTSSTLTLAETGCTSYSNENDEVAFSDDDEFTNVSETDDYIHVSMQRVIATHGDC